MSGRTAPGPTSVPDRWPALDGLRAVAVLLVVGYHAAGAVGHGALGVDIFFVLSGFLITTLLASEVQRSGRVDLRRFYRRRLLRLAPAFVVMCVVLVVLAAVTGRQARAVAEGALASVLYVANVWLFTGHDMPLLQHTWTLAMESQFYLVWPLLIGAVLHRRAAGTLILLSCLTFVVVVEVAALGSVAYSYARAVGLPLGCALALALRAGPRGAGRWTSWVAAAGGPALVLLVALALVPRDGLPVLNAELAFVPSVLALPVLVSLTRRGWWTGVLSHPACVWLGARSYSLYLWHLPVLSVLINQLTLGPLALRLVVGVVLSLVLADVSYRRVELPFLRRAHRDRVGRDA